MLNFDEWLTNYTLFGFLLVLIFAFLYFKGKPNWEKPYKASHWLWALAFFGLLFFMRYPFIAYNHELDIDESQMIVQGMSLKKFWIYWKYVDGLTQGPLSSYALIVPSWFGLPFDYTSARLLGFVILSFTLATTFLTFKNLFTPLTALIAFIPIAFFYLLSQGSFSTLYNEYFVLFLLALCFWLFSIIYRQSQPDIKLLFLLGFVSGMVPFAKLQGVPTALIIVIFTGIILLQRSTQKVKALASLYAGGLFFPLLVLGLTIRYGAFEYFWKFYLVGNSQYSSGESIWQKVLHYPGFLAHSGQFLFLFICYSFLIIFALLILIRSRTLLKSTNLLFWFGLIHIAIAFYAVIKSGYFFPHYQQFLIIPFGIFSGVVMEAALKAAQLNFRKVELLSLAWMLICVSPHVINKLATVTGHASLPGIQIRKEAFGTPLFISPVSREIMKYTRPGDNITLWGWHPAYHLETKLTQATGDAITYRIMTPSPKQKSYLAKYLNDIKASRPTIFIDLMSCQSFWFNDPAQYNHERIASLQQFIAQNYQQVITVDDERIYVLKERLKALSN
ncbi:hypothetical protein [Dyadobacter pollutisoli]|uniref:Uncharacterized protein n=1 Tax=Dyadobacter pollutisoli TaxID=2910158 RepID=A0A9E8NH77_9BACT|nr:hypothetical protein [Dyadobacter pollutisoli]WAC13989.1 hypothetical protein ON006_08495 [Dyadobacter pollutisoli]